jgi:RNA polymerase sigma-70 factor, ECF subfamily
MLSESEEEEPFEQALARARSEAGAPTASRPPGPDFEQLYAIYFGFTWRVLRHLGVPAPAMDDAVQEVWLVVHRRLDRFEGRSALKTWLFGIALNVVRNQRRAEERRVRYLLEPELLRDAPPDPEMEQHGREAWDRVQRFLSTLDAERREIFVCSLLEHLPAQETAEATGVDVTTVYQRVRSLRQAFKTWLDRVTAEPEAGA